MHFCIVGSTLSIWFCHSARANTPAVWIHEFHVGLLAIESTNLLSSWRFGGAGHGPLLSPSSPHVLCSLSPYGITLIGQDNFFVWHWAFCGASAPNNSCKVCLNLLETSDGFCGG